ncbi:MAG: ABC transporter substrate-binding protein, partial [Proteobacteria bacterium]|nr:ABC transporter substrate-binding protein [Pseudomonadota bacterium]
IKEPGSSPGRRKRQFRELLSENFDLDTIGRFVLGRSWRAATPAQRRQYATLFRTFFLETYAVRFEALRETIFTRAGDDADRIFGALRVRIIQVRRVNERDSLVTTEIGLPGRAPLHVGYRVRAGNGALKIVDVIAEGLSLLVTRRSEFAAVVKRHGVAGLLDLLRARGANTDVKEVALGNAR